MPIAECLFGLIIRFSYRSYSHFVFVLFFVLNKSCNHLFIFVFVLCCYYSFWSASNGGRHPVE